MNCHMCDSETDYHCQDCDLPVCEDCAVVMTLQNQIDYTKCQECEDGDEARSYLDNLREWKKEEAVKVKKEARKKARHIAYWKPEAVTKRRIAKEKRRIEKIELHKKQMENAAKVIGEMFRGMF